MNRNILNSLKKWKTNPKRKPLLLMGARQVGKTHVLHVFGQLEYLNYVYLNFEDMPTLDSLFSKSLDPHNIIKVLSIEKNVKILPHKTLIIFDEVQECPNALNSLKYFCEKASDYHICAAGSLLGVKLSHTRGFPVGKVDFLHLYPFSFSEFLDALNETQLKNYMSEIKKIEPLPEILHDKLMRYFKIYSYVGGMPEAMADYIEFQDLNRAREIQKKILNGYQLDFSKHAPADQIMRINQVWQSIPSQLAKENKKFIYSVVRKGARVKEFEMAIQWLFEAGLIYKVFNISTPKIPLKAYMHFNFFKIYLLDVGLLGAMTNLSAKTVIHGDVLFQEFRGSIAENSVAQMLSIKNQELYYWSSEGKAELDFIIQNDDNIYPVEVKSGESSRKKSLLVYADKYKPVISIRCSPMNLKRDRGILNVPFYLFEQWDKMVS
ncbi:MAG: hypothetical protein A3E82_03815 [Gammaproteobacteria bacterium RIFCSPHIGHO2_12_FULL_38_11]|nr:MAG: hypothetical protein A3E82_03815 [Gammaproteobacteria bacterium RIFCSPHIGHO2_12_FULL_38_11]